MLEKSSFDSAVQSGDGNEFLNKIFLLLETYASVILSLKTCFLYIGKET
jgi:hypothetical protein